jgi:ribosomal protein S27E
MKTEKEVKEVFKIKCPKCGHEWYTKSNLVFVTCPSCLNHVKNPKRMREK